MCLTVIYPRLAEPLVGGAAVLTRRGRPYLGFRERCRGVE